MRGLDSEKRKNQAQGELIPEAEPELLIERRGPPARKHVSKPRMKAKIQSKGNAESQQVPRTAPASGAVGCAPRPTCREHHRPAAAFLSKPPREARGGTHEGGRAPREFRTAWTRFQFSFPRACATLNISEKRGRFFALFQEETSWMPHAAPCGHDSPRRGKVFPVCSLCHALRKHAALIPTPQSDLKTLRLASRWSSRLVPHA